jgi:hypothetical protein
MAKVIKMLLALRVYADNKYFPKNSSFFHNFILPSEDDVYVKIYETASFQIKKQIFTSVLWVAFSILRAH